MPTEYIPDLFELDSSGIDTNVLTTDSLSCRVNVYADRQQRIVGLRHEGGYVFALAETRAELDGQHHSVLEFSA